MRNRILNKEKSENDLCLGTTIPSGQRVLQKESINEIRMGRKNMTPKKLN